MASSSPDPDAAAKAAVADGVRAAGTITFSEYPVGTYITDQYKSKGVVFGGDSPFIATDSSNPTSPVLSGSPLFFGELTLSIVDPSSGAASTARGVTLDVGYIDNPGSVQISYYGPGWNLLGRVQANALGINTVALPVAGVALVVLTTIGDEPAGFAIDNVSINTVTPVGVTRMVSLGDSYTSGEGLLHGRGNTYDCGTDMHRGFFLENTTVGPGTDPAQWCDTLTGGPINLSYYSHPLKYYENMCHRSGTAWPNVVRQFLGLAAKDALFVACSGATTANLGYLSSGNKSQYPSSPGNVAGAHTQKTDAQNFLTSSAKKVDFVTVGVGGNDAKFADILKRCLTALWTTCSNDNTFKNSTLSSIENEVYENLVTTFAGIRSQFPAARVLTYGYPSVLDPNLGCGGTTGLTPGDRAWLQNTVLPTLNQSVADAAATAGITFMPIDQITKGHEVCSSDPWINGLRLGSGGSWLVTNESFHPNQSAHAAVASYFLAHYTDGNGHLLFANPAKNPALRESHYQHLSDVGRVTSSTAAFCGAGCAQPICSPDVCLLLVRGEGFAPNTTLTVTMYSTPTIIGTVKTDATGQISASLEVPPSVGDGDHTLILKGTGSNGLPQEGTDRVNISRFQLAPPKPTTPNQALVIAVFEDFLARPPSPGEFALDTAGLDAGALERADLPRALSSSPEWVGTVVNKLYSDTLGREGDEAGVAYWTNLLRAGTITVAQTAASFYASPEYFSGIGGGTAATWVTDLYTKLLLRAPDAPGLSYWVNETARLGRTNVAFSFFQSSESAHARVAALYQRLLQRDPDAGGWNYWADQVTRNGDLALAADLASSAEYYARAQKRFP